MQLRCQFVPLRHKPGRHHNMRTLQRETAFEYRQLWHPGVIQNTCTSESLFYLGHMWPTCMLSKQLKEQCARVTQMSKCLDTRKYQITCRVNQAGKCILSESKQPFPTVWFTPTATFGAECDDIQAQILDQWVKGFLNENIRQWGKHVWVEILRKLFLLAS